MQDDSGHVAYGASGEPTRYWDIVPNERIVYTYELLLDETRISVSLTTVDLKPEGARTRLVVTEYGAFFDGLEPRSCASRAPARYSTRLRSS